jgi:DNA-binding protein H-NS
MWSKKPVTSMSGCSGETWAGRGVKPKWMVEALKKGKKMESFLIQRR